MISSHTVPTRTQWWVLTIGDLLRRPTAGDGLADPNSSLKYPISF